MTPAGKMTTVYDRRQVPEGVGFVSGPPFRDVAVDPRGRLILPTVNWSVYMMDLKTTPVTIQAIAGRNIGDSAQCLATGEWPLRRRLGNNSQVVVGADGQLYIFEHCVKRLTQTTTW